MARLIDDSFLEDRCKRQKSDEWNKKVAPSSWADAYEQFLTDIENCPTVDAVPVVRCRECKWFGLAGCAIQIVDDTDKPSEDDFCSFGERKGGDE